MTRSAARRSWGEALEIYTRRPVVTMLFLGFSAGLPLVLVFNTLSAWLRDEGVTRTAIGFFSWVALTYGLKVLWAPLVDHLRLPVLHRLMGRRRSWMLLAIAGVAAGLVGMAMTDPTAELAWVAVFALTASFSSATQDIAIDAFRIESAPPDMQGAMSGTYQAGYMFAVKIAGGAGAPYIAAFVDWRPSYLVMAALMGVGAVTVLLAREPIEQVRRRGEGIVDAGGTLVGRALAWMVHAVIDPFVDFFRRNGWIALVILAFIGLFRISDITLGVMANPFYLDMDYTKSDIATATKVVGLFVTIGGALLGGVLVSRYGVMRMLLASAVLLVATNLLFAVIAWIGRDALVAMDAPLLGGLASLGSERFWVLASAVSADNLALGISGSAFIAYLSSLTSVQYTATQYALFSSFMLLPGKLIAGFSGVVVDLAGYVVFFVYASALGLPALALVLGLIALEKRGHLSRRRGDEVPDPAE